MWSRLLIITGWILVQITRAATHAATTAPESGLLDVVAIVGHHRGGVALLHSPTWLRNTPLCGRPRLLRASEAAFLLTFPALPFEPATVMNATCRTCSSDTRNPFCSSSMPTGCGHRPRLPRLPNCYRLNVLVRSLAATRVPRGTMCPGHMGKLLRSPERQ